MNYTGPRMYPGDLVGYCMCGLNKGAHRPSEAYYMEERLEGRKSSSMALRRYGCAEYKESGVTLAEAMNLRGCMYKWRRARSMTRGGA
jgi:hypothetical protein